MRLILPVLILQTIRAQVEENCERDDCLKDEPENAMLLQAFTDKKYDKNFARDVLQVSKFETVKACNAVVFGGDGMSPGGPFNHKGTICGNLELKEGDTQLCGKTDKDKVACWNIQPGCTETSNPATRYYTYKWTDGDEIGKFETITPPTGYGICITGTCTKSGSEKGNSGGGQRCTEIDNPVAGAGVQIKSINAPDPPDISNYRIQYACGCGRGGDPNPDTPNPDTPGGGGDGDPHIHTMKGEHYTLIKQGTFLAFSFKGKEALVAAPYASGSEASRASRVPVDFELFAHYNNGRKSFTRGLLLLDHQNHQAIEMTSEDCRWRVRAGESDWKTLTEWRKSVSKSEVSSDILYKRGSGAYVTGLNISRAEMIMNISKTEMNAVTTQTQFQNLGGKTFESYTKAVILINMNTPTGLTDVAKLKVKCFPGYHMNYKVRIYDGKDLPLVGGELGGTSSGPKETAEFLHVGQGTIQMRSDSGFQYHQKWEELGGSASAAEYLQDQDDSAPESSKLMTTPCTESDQHQAKEICRKAGLKNEATLSFAECVFDVCRAGGDALPELTEISWHEDD
mmetsp:Transcript_21735/g.36014  ORF Transcript_21735/g.36014 Transcript_21735/m.36014 type:complete len:568 (+) Transcript_21735:65-1768(+)